MLYIIMFVLFNIIISEKQQLGYPKLFFIIKLGYIFPLQCKQGKHQNITSLENSNAILSSW